MGFRAIPPPGKAIFFPPFSQGGLAAEMKKIRETHSKLKDHEKEYKTQITNLWQNNGKLDNEVCRCTEGTIFI